MRGLKEIILTTIRCYQGTLYDKGICPHIENFAEDIYWRWQWKVFYVSPQSITNNLMVDLLKDCFEDKEADGWAERKWPL